MNVELLYPDLGIEEPLQTVAGSYGLDAEALIGVARHRYGLLPTARLSGPPGRLFVRFDDGVEGQLESKSLPAP